MGARRRRRRPRCWRPSEAYRGKGVVSTGARWIVLTPSVLGSFGFLAFAGPTCCTPTTHHRRAKPTRTS
eukprot:964234-Prymnesium_polylepis.1